jgi:hypothetical protein
MQSDANLKEISYRGGLVTFRVPAHWVEEYGRDGGAMFYEDAPNSPTFRFEVISAQSPSVITCADAPKVLAELANTAPVDEIEVLSNGNALVKYVQSPIDRGQMLHITYWSVAQVIPSNNIRIATFSYTLLSGQELEHQFQRELQLLDAEVRSSVFWPHAA